MGDYEVVIFKIGRFYAGDMEATALVVAARLPEGRALLGVLHARVHAALRRAHGHGGDRDAPLVEDPQEVRVPAAPLAQEVGLRHPHAVEGERVRVRRVPAVLFVGRLRGKSTPPVRAYAR